VAVAATARDAGARDDMIAAIADDLANGDVDAAHRRARDILMLVGAMASTTATTAHGHTTAAGDAPLVFDRPVVHPGDLAIAREQLVDLLAAHGVARADAQRSALVAFELGANALQHGAPPYSLHVRRDPGVTLVAVRDAADAQPARPAGEAPGGLALVARQSVAWGVAPRVTHGKDVWAVIADSVEE
jgi:hypothetical protein